MGSDGSHSIASFVLRVRCFGRAKLNRAAKSGGAMYSGSENTTSRNK